MPRLMSLSRSFASAALALLAVTVAGCDFTPALDIDLPDHEPGTVINAVLAADSVASVRVGVSTDPYVDDYENSYRFSETNPAAVVTLLRDGQLVERLRLRREACQRYDRRTGTEIDYECGLFVGAMPLEMGRRYTIRAEQPGMPVAEGTVTLPLRPALAVEEEATAEGADRRFRVRVADPSGRGNRYGVALILGPYRETGTVCDYRVNPPVCTDTTFVRRQPVYFSSSDPAILAAARDFDLNDTFFRFISVTDDSFDGQTWAFSMSSGGSYGYGYGYETDGGPPPLTVQIAALSDDVFGAYQIATFGGQDEENPFLEPANLPSNVTGGYGLVGGLALAEVTLQSQPSTTR